MSAQLLRSIEQYCADRGVAPSMFGRAAVNDPRLVEDLRSGRQPRQETVDRIVSLIRDGKALPSANPKSGEAAEVRREAMDRARRQHWVRHPHPILADIARFLLASGMSASAFGSMAMDDSKFVESLRWGRRIQPRTVRRVRDFMQGEMG